MATNREKRQGVKQETVKQEKKKWRIKYISLKDDEMIAFCWLPTIVSIKEVDPFQKYTLFIWLGGCFSLMKGTKEEFENYKP